MIQKLQQIFHSITKSLEVLYVIEGNKPCARILVFEGDFDKATDFFKNNKLNFAISDFKVIKQNTQSEFYSDKSIKIPKNSAEKGYFFVYLSKNNETADKARLMEENSSHKQLGLTLGYPKCCCEFFEKNFSESATDLTLKALSNLKGYEFPFYNNIAARHFDISLLSHFPHNFSCEPSVEIANNNLNIIKKYLPDLAELFVKTLQSVVIYTNDEGIFLLRKYEKNNNEIIYSDVLSTAKSKMYFLISSNNKLKIIDRNNFFVNDVGIKGNDYGIMVFG